MKFSPKIKVLYIDDEVQNLNVFKNSFKKKFEIFTASSADEGLKILNQHPIEIIISDQKMPDTTGIDFFESIKEKHPNPIRILLTGYTNIETVIESINRGEVYRYITKPWNTPELELTIQNAHKFYTLQEEVNKLNRKYQKVFTSTNDPILLFDLEGKVSNFNNATLKFSGYDSLKLSSLHFSKMLHFPFDTKKIISLLNKNKKIENYECKLKIKSGELKTILISAHPILNNYNKIVNYQALIKDITEQIETKQILLKNTLKIQEEERERISRELHDNIGQKLVVLKLQVEPIKGQESMSKRNEALNTFSTEISQTIVELRKLCYDILPPAILEHDIKYAINELAEKIRKGNIEVETKVSENLPFLTKELKFALYRIIQEFITNSIKYAKCSKIELTISSGEAISIELRDNGIGFDYKQAKKGLGLNNILSRVESFNGTLEVESSDGVLFKISIPLNKKISKSSKLNFIKKVETPSLNIKLSEEKIIFINPQKINNNSILLDRSKKDAIIITSILENLKVPFLKIIPDSYPDSEALNMHKHYTRISSAIAYVYSSKEGKIKSEKLYKYSPHTIPINAFDNQHEAIIWAKQFI